MGKTLYPTKGTEFGLRDWEVLAEGGGHPGHVN